MQLHCNVGFRGVGCPYVVHVSFRANCFSSNASISVFNLHFFAFCCLFVFVQVCLSCIFYLSIGFMFSFCQPYTGHSKKSNSSSWVRLQLSVTEAYGKYFKSHTSATRDLTIEDGVSLSGGQCAHRWGAGAAVRTLVREYFCGQSCRQR